MSFSWYDENPYFHSSVYFNGVNMNKDHQDEYLQHKILESLSKRESKRRRSQGYEEDGTDSTSDSDCSTDSSNDYDRKKAPIAAKRKGTTKGPVAKRAKREEKGAVKLGTPHDDELEELGSDIGAAWRKLGRRLKVTEAELTAIHKENEELAEKGFKTLLHWKQSNAGGTTYQVLYDALNHRLVGRSDLAKKYCVD